MDRAKDTFNQVNTKVQDVVRNRGAVAVFVILTIMLIVVIIAYIVWKMNRSNLKGTTLITTPKKLMGTVYDPIQASRLPAMSVGQEFSWTFWLYMSDFQVTSQHKLIFMRNTASSIGNSRYKTMNPVVMVDKFTNKMYICLLTNRTPNAAPQSLDDILTATGVNATFMVATIDYVPMQRWVNVTFTTDQNLLSVFLDGNLYTVQSLYDMRDTSAAASINGLVTPLFQACTGDVRVGTFDTAMSSPLTGFISNLQFFNYSLSANDSKGIYNIGPDTGFSLLRMLGVPEYGVRSPVYRLDDQGASATSSTALGAN